MKKNCIFNKSVVCTDCGDCNVCDLNSSKMCNNCGKCLELEGYDLKAIKIDEIVEEDNYNDSTETGNNVPGEEDEVWDFIDDIKELKDLLDEDKVSENEFEVFPGLLKFTKKKREED